MHTLMWNLSLASSKWAENRNQKHRIHTAMHLTLNKHSFFLGAIFLELLWAYEGKVITGL